MRTACPCPPRLSLLRQRAERLPGAGLWLPWLAALWWLSSSGDACAAEAPQQLARYKPEPVSVGWQTWVGLAAALTPLIVATAEFTKRIVCAGYVLTHLCRPSSHTGCMRDVQMIQRRCETCQGTGLVQRGGKVRKCLECGGMFPWQVCNFCCWPSVSLLAAGLTVWAAQGWDNFFKSTARPGNGGPLQQPRGQTSVLYKCVPPSVRHAQPRA